MSIKWYHFSFRKKKKKQVNSGTSSNAITKVKPLGPNVGSVWAVAIPPLAEPLGKCECCGGDIYNQIRECELCGKKVCENCTLVITKLYQTIIISASTQVPVYGSGMATPIPGWPQGKPHKDILICVSCSDLLKLSLRIAAAQGMVEKDESGEE